MRPWSVRKIPPGSEIARSEIEVPRVQATLRKILAMIFDMLAPPRERLPAVDAQQQAQGL